MDVSQLKFRRKCDAHPPSVTVIETVYIPDNGSEGEADHGPRYGQTAA